MLVEKLIHFEYFNAELPIVVPYYDHGIKATFSGLFSDVVQEEIDLMKLLIPRPTSTFLVKVGGVSMNRDRILPNDRILIDKSLPYKDGKKIAYFLRDFDGWTVKRLSITQNGYYLLPLTDDDSMKPYKIKDYDLPWGMVTWILFNEYNNKK